MLFQFPEPYPGECLYSILCRFHNRSANRTPMASMEQLFGKRKSLRNTLYSPAALEYADSWFQESAVMSADYLRNNHTMINFAASVGKGRGYKITIDNKTKHYYYFSNALLYHGKKLRYCPSCARAQKKLYGEPYWQMLPQIEGVEICPVHGEVYRESTVGISEISYRFYPASLVLMEEGNEDDIPVNLDAITENLDMYQTVSRESDWILHNGSKCVARESDRIIQYFKKTLTTFDIEFLKFNIEKIGLDADIINELNSLVMYIVYLITSQQYIYLISSMFGSIDRFNKSISN